MIKIYYKNHKGKGPTIFIKIIYLYFKYQQFFYSSTFRFILKIKLLINILFKIKCSFYKNLLKI